MDAFSNSSADLAADDEAGDRPAVGGKLSATVTILDDNNNNDNSTDNNNNDVNSTSESMETSRTTGTTAGDASENDTDSSSSSSPTNNITDSTEFTLELNRIERELLENYLREVNGKATERDGDGDDEEEGPHELLPWEDWEDDGQAAPVDQDDDSGAAAAAGERGNVYIYIYKIIYEERKEKKSENTYLS